MGGEEERRIRGSFPKQRTCCPSPAPVYCWPFSLEYLGHTMVRRGVWHGRRKLDRAEDLHSADFLLASAFGKHKILRRYSGQFSSSYWVQILKLIAN